MTISYKIEKQLNLRIQYSDKSNNAYLTKLKNNNDLENLIDHDKCDFQNIMNVRSWVSSKWEQDSSILKKQHRSRNIFKSSESANHLRGVEYSLMLKACLRSLGFTVRTLFLGSNDLEYSKKREKHIFFEAYLKDLNKWFFLDPQFDIVIKQNKAPLNAVEFQQAMINEEELEVENPSEIINSEEYLEWVGSYLFYFTTSLNKGGVNLFDRISKNKKRLTLVPLNEEIPIYSQKIMRIRNSLITNSIADFYPELDI